MAVNGCAGAPKAACSRRVDGRVAPPHREATQCNGGRGRGGRGTRAVRCAPTEGDNDVRRSVRLLGAYDLRIDDRRVPPRSLGSRKRRQLLELLPRCGAAHRAGRATSRPRRTVRRACGRRARRRPRTGRREGRSRGRRSAEQVRHAHHLTRRASLHAVTQRARPPVPPPLEAWPAAPAAYGTQNSGGPSWSTQEVSGVIQGSARNARAIWVGQGRMSTVPWPMSGKTTWVLTSR